MSSAAAALALALPGVASAGWTWNDGTPAIDGWTWNDGTPSIDGWSWNDAMAAPAVGSEISPAGWSWSGEEATASATL
jgi:hypothetical protein